MKIVQASFPHRRALFVLLGLLIAAGVQSVFSMSRSIYPHVAFPRIAVIAERGETPIRTVLITVTRVIEQAVSAVPDLVRVRSKTVRGAAEFSLDFAENAVMGQSLALVRGRIAESSLPPDTVLTIEQQTPSIFPVMSFNVLPSEEDADDPIARARLAEWVDLDLKPRLSRLPDAFLVTVQTGDRREHTFEADPLALARAGVGILDVQDALSAWNDVTAVGRSMTEGLQYQLLVDGLARSPEHLLEIAIPREGEEPARLGDLGQWVESVAERTMIVTGDGRDGVVVSVFLRDGGRVTELSAGVAAILEEVRPLLPHGAVIAPVYDQSRLVGESIDGVRDAIMLGAILSVVVMAFFLGNWRVTLVAGLAIPLSVLLTLASLRALGESLNLMSLGGLAVAIGLVIDDAIVVVENVARRLGKRGAEADQDSVLREVAEGSQQVVGSIIGSSLTTVVVFLPLVLLEGLVGQFFRSLALALGVSILASMVISLIYSPLILLLPGLRPRGMAGTGPRMRALQDRYGRFVEKVIEHRFVSATGCLAAIVIGTLGLGSLRTGFLPEMDEGGFVLDYFLPVGSSLAETDATCRRIESLLRETPEVVSFSRRTGAELGFFATEQFTGDFLVGLVPPGERTKSVFEVMDELRDRIARQVPQAEVEFVQVIQDTINDLAGAPSPIEVKIFGSECPPLQSTAHQIAERIRSIPGVVDVTENVSFGSPELSWRPDPLAAARLGLDMRTIAAECRAQLLGTVVTQIQEGDRLVDVRVRYPLSWRSDASVDGDGPALFIPQAGDRNRSGLLPLSSIATFSRSLAENELERENQNPLVRVSASVSGRDLGSASRAVEAAVRALSLTDSGVRIEYGGQSASQKSAFHTMLLVFGLGTGLVFLLLVVQFRSLALPAVIFLALPFGQIGGLLALRLIGVSLNISSGMGLVMLVGLVVKNGIIMIDYAQDLFKEGRSERDAILEAARVRLRPILMTTFAAIAGLTPLAVGIAPGMELQRPLAITVIGGLVVSTAFTLIVVPFGCSVLARGRLVPPVESHV